MRMPVAADIESASQLDFEATMATEVGQQMHLRIPGLEREGAQDMSSYPNSY